MLLASHDYDEAEELAAVRRLIERGVDGLVLVGLRHARALFELLENAGQPYELTWSIDPSGEHFCVGVDHRQAAAELTQYLLSLGHREFAVIAGELETNDRAFDRMQGVRDALAAAGMQLSEQRVVQASFAISSGRQSLATLLDRAPGFTAVVCANDVLAIGAMQECTARQLRVPTDMSVVGFDDIEMASAVLPALTTVRMPSADIGRAAAARLLARLAGEPVARCEQLPTLLITRASTARVPQ